MSKCTRKIVGLLMGLLMILSVVAPATAMAAVAPEPSPTTRPETGNLHIHKLVFNDGNFDDTIINNDGLQRDVSMYETLAEVEFTIYFADDYEVDADPSSIDTSLLTEAGKGETNNDGYLKFENLNAGRYLVVETNTPKGVTNFSPQFLVDVPMMNPNGREWNSDVHVYPKNQLILGSAELTKRGAENKLLSGITFDLFKVVEDGEDLKINQVPLMTEEGKIFVGELEVGKYYFMETATLPEYGLDQTEIPFEITLDDHDVKQEVDLTNHLLPKIEKYVTEVERKEDSAYFKNPVKWIIEADVPIFINFPDGNELVSYVIEDTMDPELIYQDDLTILELDDSDYEVQPVTSDNKLRIVFEIDALKELEGSKLTIEFTTLFDDNATVMGADIENNVELIYHNGFKEYDDTSSATVWTGGRQFRKVDASNAELGLEGAKFIIQNSNGKYLTSNYEWVDSRDDAWEIKSVEDGYFEIKGLAEGLYTLIEIEAPKLGDVQYRLGADIDFMVDKDTYGDTHLMPIENRREMTLPETGGMGTLLFSIIGLGLMGTSAKLYKKSEKK
ncbi:SpaA isopeptide-forming pilin-related protein [Alkalibacterium sp.]|nr:MAG: isopeptide-forming domain-containing fimbrial protein [Alkalibacterium sp.]